MWDYLYAENHPRCLIIHQSTNRHHNSWNICKNLKLHFCDPWRMLSIQGAPENSCNISEWKGFIIARILFQLKLVICTSYMGHFLTQHSRSTSLEEIWRLNLHHVCYVVQATKPAWCLALNTDMWSFSNKRKWRSEMNKQVEPQGWYYWCFDIKCLLTVSTSKKASNVSFLQPPFGFLFSLAKKQVWS